LTEQIDKLYNTYHYSINQLWNYWKTPPTTRIHAITTNQNRCEVQFQKYFNQIMIDSCRRWLSATHDTDNNNNSVFSVFSAQLICHSTFCQPILDARETLSWRGTWHTAAAGVVLAAVLDVMQVCVASDLHTIDFLTWIANLSDCTPWHQCFSNAYRCCVFVSLTSCICISFCWYQMAT